MGAWTSQRDGNWTRTSDNADSPWYDGGAQTALATVPGSGDTVAIATTHDVTLDQTSPASLTCTSITIAGTGTLVIPASTSFTVNANIINNGTATTGAILVGTDQSLTINGQLSNTNSGYAVTPSGNGSVVVTNSGATAINASNGRCISSAGGTGTGTLTVTGAVVASGGAGGIFWQSTGALNINGNISSSSTWYGVQVNASAIVTITGTLTCTGTGGCLYTSGNSPQVTVDGNISSTAGTAVYCGYGTITWIGNRTLAAGAYCYIGVGVSATLALAKADPGGGALSLANSGVFVVTATSLTATLTLTAGGYTAAIVNQSAAAQAAILNRAGTVTGPTLPAAGDVETGSGQYGYAGALQTPSYPTTATSKAEQLAADQAEVNGNKAKVLYGETVLTGCETGTMPRRFRREAG